MKTWYQGGIGAAVLERVDSDALTRLMIADTIPLTSAHKCYRQPDARVLGSGNTTEGDRMQQLPGYYRPLVLLIFSTTISAAFSAYVAEASAIGTGGARQAEPT